ncbi:class I SAM-dependent methyltransferase [uncultured Thalassospira sp.]|uniref:class I SAM-dependent methyltransferase n=1 Tax=uncultured Thalassospira sp. TaxID=404382 RepID=UPI00258C1A06|nr:class I SAM-dependent methyltransferase [uncultured Thalassospira sp.]
MVFITSDYNPKTMWMEFSDDEVSRLSFIKACPVCGEDESLRPVVKLGPKHFKNMIQIGICSHCFSITYMNPPSSNFFEDYYANTWNTARGENVENLNIASYKSDGKFARILDAISLKNKSAKILDFGCGNGAKLSGLKDAGFSEVHGIEASSYRAAVTEKNFPGRVYFGQYQDYDRPRDFDVVCSNHVLEHVFSPGDALKWIVESTNNDAVIVINVPNCEAESVVAQCLFLPHLHSMSKKAMQVLAEKYDLKLFFFKSKRNTEISAIFIKGSPDVDLTGDTIIEGASVEHSPLEARIERIQAPWKLEKGEKTISYGMTHNGKSLSQRVNGYTTVTGFRSVIYRGLTSIFKILRKLGMVELSKRMYFFLPRLSNDETELLNFCYVHVRAEKTTECDIPRVSLRDDRLGLLMK